MNKAYVFAFIFLLILAGVSLQTEATALLQTMPGWANGAEAEPPTGEADNPSSIEGEGDTVTEEDDENIDDNPGDEQKRVEPENPGDTRELVFPLPEELQLVDDPKDILVLVNKEYNLPPDYVPPDLTVPDVPFSFQEDLPQKQMREEAARALERLFAAAVGDDISLVAVSGYRSYERQRQIFTSRAKERGVEVANRTTAFPGQSEHQTGLAMDVSSSSVGMRLVQSFGEREEGIWLAENASEFGFIVRYPKGKEHITGYSYEPWHLRYVGVKAAREMNAQGLTLEEYLGKGGADSLPGEKSEAQTVSGEEEGKGQ